MYAEEEKKIFSYFDGTAEVWGDPIAIERRLTQLLDGNPNAFITRSTDPNGTMAYEAAERLWAAVRVAFDMPFTKADGGATEDQVTAALDKFSDYLEKKNQSGASTPTPLRLSVVADLGETASVTRDSSDCG